MANKKKKRTGDTNGKPKGITTLLKTRLSKMGALSKAAIQKAAYYRKKQSIAPRKGKQKRKGTKYKPARMSASTRGVKIHSLVKDWINRQLQVAGRQFTKKSIESILDTRCPGITRAARALATWVLDANLVPTHAEFSIGVNQIDMIVKNRLTNRMEIVEIKTKSTTVSEFKAKEGKPVQGFSKSQMTSQSDQAQLQLAEYRRCVKDHFQLQYLPFGRILYTFTSGCILPRVCDDKYMKIKLR